MFNILRYWMQIWIKFDHKLNESNTLEDYIIAQSIYNFLISYVHLRSEHCIMLLFNLVRTSKNVIMKIEIKL